MNLSRFSLAISVNATVPRWMMIKVAVFFLMTSSYASGQTLESTTTLQQNQQESTGGKTNRLDPELIAREATAVEASTLLLSHFEKAKAKTCASLYAALGTNLVGNAEFAVRSTFAEDMPDKQATQGLAGLRYRNPEGYSGSAAGIVFASPNGQECEGNSVRVVPLPEDCVTARTLLPEGSVAEDPLGEVAVFALPGAGQVMFLPSVSGCVAITVLRAASSSDASPR